MAVLDTPPDQSLKRLHQSTTPMNERRFYVWHIQWDVGSNDTDISLPSQCVVYVNNNGQTDEMIEDYISDYLSDEYGFCHHGFDYEER